MTPKFTIHSHSLALWCLRHLWDYMFERKPIPIIMKERTIFLRLIIFERTNLLCIQYVQFWTISGDMSATLLLEEHISFQYVDFQWIFQQKTHCLIYDANHTRVVILSLFVVKVLLLLGAVESQRKTFPNGWRKWRSYHQFPTTYSNWTFTKPYLVVGNGILRMTLAHTSSRCPKFKYISSQQYICMAFYLWNTSAHALQIM